MTAAEDLDAVLARNPGTTEAHVRSYLRGAYGSSQALTDALTSGAVVRVGQNLYRKQDR